MPACGRPSPISQSSWSGEGAPHCGPAQGRPSHHTDTGIGRLSGLEVVFARDLMLKVDRKRADCPNSFRSTWTRRATASEGEARSSNTRSRDCSSHQTRCAHLLVNSPGSSCAVSSSPSASSQVSLDASFSAQK